MPQIAHVKFIAFTNIGLIAIIRALCYDVRCYSL